MLAERKITMEAQTVVDDVAICRHIAVIKPEAGSVSLLRSMLDEVACKNNRVILRADQAQFEDAAYDMLDKMTKVAEE